MTNTRWTRALLGATLGAALLLAACGGEPAEPVADSAAEPTRDPAPDVTPDTDGDSRSESPTRQENKEAEKEEDDEEEAGSNRPAGIPDRGQPVTVQRIVDGDTLELAATASGGVLSTTTEIDVRLLEIDTPETKHPSEPVQCYGKKATRALGRLLPEGSWAWVQRDEELRDRYDRYLLYMWNADGVFVNLHMVQRGYARAVLYEPNDRYWDRISAAEQRARSAGKGLWGACPYFGAPAKQPEPEPRRGDGGGYPVPPPPPDRDCSEISATDFRVRPGDPHRFDRDGDGIGCET